MLNPSDGKDKRAVFLISQFIKKEQETNFVKTVAVSLNKRMRDHNFKSGFGEEMEIYLYPN